MLIIDQLISDSEIAAFKKYFQDNYNKRYVNWALENDNIIDHRLLIDERSAEFDIIRRISSMHFKNHVDLWSAYQRQSQPHFIHIDDYKSDQKNLFRYTYILAMDTVPEFKTIVWKEKCWDNNELHEYITKWGKIRKFKKKTSNISEIEDLEHTFDENQQDYLADYLSLDGIYPYKTGTGCLFDATQLHCTSNWLKYKKFPYRELLQIHITTTEPVDF